MTDLAASSAEVWSALTDPDRVVAWAGARVGRAGVDVRDHDPGHRLAVGWDPGAGEPASTVDLTLRPAPGRGTRLEVRHTGLADPTSYAVGRQLALDALVAHLTGLDPGDVAGRDRDALLGRQRELLARQLRC